MEMKVEWCDTISNWGRHELSFAGNEEVFSEMSLSTCPFPQTSAVRYCWRQDNKPDSQIQSYLSNVFV